MADFATAFRVDEAKRLLAVSKKPLFEISSQSHFQNVFKQTVGLTPMQYREQKGEQ